MWDANMKKLKQKREFCDCHWHDIIVVQTIRGMYTLNCGFNKIWFRY